MEYCSDKWPILARSPAQVVNKAVLAVLHAFVYLPAAINRKVNLPAAASPVLFSV